MSDGGSLITFEMEMATQDKALSHSKINGCESRLVFKYQKEIGYLGICISIIQLNWGINIVMHVVPKL